MEAGCGETGETGCAEDVRSRTMDVIEVVGFQGELGNEEYMEKTFDLKRTRKK